MKLLVVLVAISRLCESSLPYRGVTVGFTPWSAPVNSQYHVQDVYGQYSYGYASPHVVKEEVRTADGVTRGGYSYIDANGILQTIQYVSDPVNGFRVAATNIPRDLPEVAHAKAQHFAAYKSIRAEHALLAARDHQVVAISPQPVVGSVIAPVNAGQPSVAPVNHVAAYIPAAIETSSQFHAQDGHGQYTYGYSDPLSAKSESKSADGVTRGGYSYLDANGVVQQVSYVSDPVNGFRVQATNLPEAPVVELIAPKVTATVVGPKDTAVAPVAAVAPVPAIPEQVISDIPLSQNPIVVYPGSAAPVHQSNPIVVAEALPTLSEPIQQGVALSDSIATDLVYRQQISQDAGYVGSPALVDGSFYKKQAGQGGLPVHQLAEAYASVPQAQPDHQQTQLLQHALEQTPVVHHGPEHARLLQHALKQHGLQQPPQLQHNFQQAHLLQQALEQAPRAQHDLQEAHLLQQALQQAPRAQHDLQEAHLLQQALQQPRAQHDLQQAHLLQQALQQAPHTEHDLQEAHLLQQALQQAPRTQHDLQEAHLLQQALQQAPRAQHDLQEAHLLQQALLQAPHLQHTHQQAPHVQHAIEQAQLQQHGHQQAPVLQHAPQQNPVPQEHLNHQDSAKAQLYYTQQTSY